MCTIFSYIACHIAFTICVKHFHCFCQKTISYITPCTHHLRHYRLLYITTYRVTGHIPWWHQLEGNLLLIIIVLAVVMILVLILICVAIYIVCRRKRSQMKCKLSLILSLSTIIRSSQRICMT